MLLETIQLAKFKKMWEAGRRLASIDMFVFLDFLLGAETI